MSNKRFELLMNSIDNELLEEAKCPMKKDLRWLRVAGSLAACFAVVLLAGLVFGPSKPSAQVVNPMTEATAGEFEQLGYSIPLPEDAANAEYFFINLDAAGSEPIAQIRYEQGGTGFVCRALKTETSTDISGIYTQWEQSYTWDLDGMLVELSQAEDGLNCIDWYDEKDGIQWSLSGGAGAVDLMKTAYGILNTLGYELNVSPANASEVEYRAFEADGLSVGETKFVLDGVVYTYRMASTNEVEEPFADISGIEKTFETEAEGEISYCPARMCFDEGGEGKVVWFDIAPGLLYSLHMDSGASEEALRVMANVVFAPAQAFSGEEAWAV